MNTSNMARYMHQYELEPAEQATAQNVPDLMKVSDLLRVVWRHKILLVFSLLVASAAGYAYLKSSKPVFRSRAKVLVVKKQPYVLSGVNSQVGNTDELSMHVMLIKSPLFIERVVEKLKSPAFMELAKEEYGLANLPLLDELSNPTPVIMSSLEVSRNASIDDYVSSHTMILDFDFFGPDREECRAILATVVDAYAEFLDENSSNANEQALTMITKNAEKVQKDLREKESEFRAFLKSAPFIGTLTERTAVHQDRLRDIESKRSELTIQKTEIQSRLEAIRRDVAAGMDHDAVAAMDGSEERKQSGINLGSTLLPLLLKQNELRKTFGEGHPDVRSIQEQINLTRNLIAEAQRDVVLDESNGQGEKEDRLGHRIRSLERELALIDGTEEGLLRLLEEQKDHLKKLADYEYEQQQYSNEIARLQQFHESLVRQIQEGGLGTDLVGYSTSVIAPATVGGQVAPRQIVIMAVAICLGLFAGGALTGIAEFIDKSFHSSHEIRRELGVPVVGYTEFTPTSRRKIRHRKAASGQFSQEIHAFHRPESLESEAYRDVRTALYFSMRHEKHKVVQITSPHMGDGKSSLCANLAVSIAKSDRSVLVVDADMRRPRQHSLFGLKNAAGLSSVLTNDAEPEDVIQETPVSKLFLLPCGNKPDNPAELLATTVFQEFLESVREKFDFVLIDTPALLPVTDPRVVAAQVDAILLALRINKRSRIDAETSREILGMLWLKVSGVVVNGMKGYADVGGIGPRYYHYVEARPSLEDSALGADRNGKAASRELYGATEKNEEG